MACELGDKNRIPFDISRSDILSVKGSESFLHLVFESSTIINPQSRDNGLVNTSNNLNEIIELLKLYFFLPLGDHLKFTHDEILVDFIVFNLGDQTERQEFSQGHGVALMIDAVES